MDTETEIEPEYGPAMAQLSPRRRAFVRELVALQREAIDNPTEAARRAGYSDHKEAAKVRAHTLMHDASVLAALREEAQRGIHLAAAVVPTPVVIEIAMDKDAKRSDRLRACEMLYNRGGLPPMTEHKVSVEHSVNREGMETLAKRLAAELGVDEARLIGANRAAADAIEADYEEVEG